MRISDWSSDVCSSDLDGAAIQAQPGLVMQFQLVATQRPAQFAFQVSEAAGIAIDAFVEYMKGAALCALGLLHGDMGVPHQRVRAGLEIGRASCRERVCQYV